MKPELRRLVEAHFGIPHPGTKKPVKNPQLDPKDPAQAAILQRNALYNALSNIEKQEIQWNQKNYDPDLKAKAAKIIAGLNGKPGKEISPDLLSEKHNIFINYFFNALAMAGYEKKTHIGSPSIGLAWTYALPLPVVCPHCRKELGPGYSKK